jgi:hypothetical protein
MKAARVRIVLLFLLIALAPLRLRAEDGLVIHEWGTITTHHAPDGTPQGRLNHIEASEVLPPFVHTFEPKVTEPSPLMKSPVTPGRPDVTMRLETPVMYFYPPANSPSNLNFDVSVDFRGGLLNEFYPQGEASVAIDYERINSKMAAGIIKQWDGSVLDNFVRGSLVWKGLTFAKNSAGPETNSSVWTAPRRVLATDVRAPSGEAERFLFYRGVAHLDALFSTTFDLDSVTLLSPRSLHWLSTTAIAVPRAWVFRINIDTVRYKELRDLKLVQSHAGKLATVKLSDLPNTRDSNALEASIGQALVDAGLSRDEASALLNTWRASYFLKPGTRVLYLVPREWLDYFLPLHVSVPAEVTRVFIGRIDLDLPSN